MLEDVGYLGCPFRVVEDLKLMNDRLNAEVVEQVNDTQELVMLNNFARESNEYEFKKRLEERMSDIASWRWVLEDLKKRLGEAIEALRYEHNALIVVMERVRDELEIHCQHDSQPGALTPMCDCVEDMILQECDFLRKQRKKFQNLIAKLEIQTSALEKTKKAIENDILNKQQALQIDKECGKITLQPGETLPGYTRRKQKKKESLVDSWEQRCNCLKRTGLRALADAIMMRQQVRGARVYLSIAAQSYASRVDSALRRRLHVNKVKLQDLYWQKDEAMRDHKLLSEEQLATEQNILETMEQERLISARLADRSLRPAGELTRDDVDRKLKDEQGRLKTFLKQLRNNRNRISNLQEHLLDCSTRIDCCIEDLLRVIHLDEERIKKRLPDEPSAASNGKAENNPPGDSRRASNTNVNNESLRNTRASIANGQGESVQDSKRSSIKNVHEQPLEIINEEPEEPDDDDVEYPFSD